MFNLASIGNFFGPAGTISIAVNYGGYAATGCTLVTPQTTLECTTVAGAGSDLAWSVSVGLQPSTSSGISATYAAPTITSIVLPPEGVPTTGKRAYH